MLQFHCHIEDCFLFVVFERSPAVETKYLSLFQDKGKAESHRLYDYHFSYATD